MTRVKISSVFVFFSALPALAFFCVLVAEPSAFELQSGATKKELKNLQTTNKNLENIAIDYNTRIQTLEQSQEGLQSVIEGQSLRIKNLLDLANGQEMRIKTLESNLDSASATISELQTQVKSLTTKLNEMSALNAKANSEILKKLESIDSTAQPKASQQKAGQPKADEAKVADSKSGEPSTAKSADDAPTSEFPKEFKHLPKKEVYEQAQKLYRQKGFEAASERYKWLAEGEYKSAFCYYMLGEIAYKQAKYREAIIFFKRSVAIDSEASYMPVVLWHTAWSFKYTKDTQNYEKFLDLLIGSYPDSEQGKKAKNLKNQTKKETK